jgi:hypothetical protein
MYACSCAGRSKSCSKRARLCLCATTLASASIMRCPISHLTPSRTTESLSAHCTIAPKYAPLPPPLLPFHPRADASSSSHQPVYRLTFAICLCLRYQTRPTKSRSNRTFARTSLTLLTVSANSDSSMPRQGGSGYVKDYSRCVRFIDVTIPQLSVSCWMRS